MPSTTSLHPYSESNPSFRKAYIRERLAANREECAALIAERTKINEMLRRNSANTGDALVAAAAKPSAGETPLPAAASPPKAESLPPAPDSAPAQAAIDSGGAAPPEPAKAEPKKKKASLWRRKGS